MYNEERGTPRRCHPILRHGSGRGQPVVSSHTMNFYISGPMSGLPNHNKHVFNSVETSIRAICNSIDPLGRHQIYNPAKIQFPETKSYQQLLRECITGLARCTHFVQLPNWEHSHGALIEYSIAVALHMEILQSKETTQWLIKNLSLTTGPKR